jgi:hypothetical protein
MKMSPLPMFAFCVRIVTGGGAVGVGVGVGVGVAAAGPAMRSAAAVVAARIVGIRITRPFWERISGRR